MTSHLLVMAVMLFSVGDDQAEETDKALEGTWTVEQAERGGRKPPAELLKSVKLIIKGNTLKMSDDNGKGEGATFTLTRAKKPYKIDLLFKEGKDGDVERSALGIYELDGDTLKFAWRKDGGPRPTEFSSIQGERTSELLILKREKDD